MAAGQREPADGIARLILEAAGDEDQGDEEQRGGGQMRGEAVLRDSTRAERPDDTIHQPSTPWRPPRTKRTASGVASFHEKRRWNRKMTKGIAKANPMTRPRKRCAHSHQKMYWKSSRRQVEVLALVLGDLLVGLELGLPVGGRERRQHAGDRLPLGDREPGVGEARDAAERDHREHQRREAVEPDADGAQPVGGSVGGGGSQDGQGVSFSGPRGIGKPPLLAMVMVTQRDSAQPQVRRGFADPRLGDRRGRASARAIYRDLAHRAAAADADRLLCRRRARMDRSSDGDHPLDGAAGLAVPEERAGREDVHVARLLIEAVERDARQRVQRLRVAMVEAARACGDG